MCDVLLICMPFGPVFSPSIGLSLLKAGLTRHERSTRIRYYSISFAERIGQDFYCAVAYEGGPGVEQLPGEWVFSAALFDQPVDGERYVDEILLNQSGACGPERPCSPGFVRRLRQARKQAAGYLNQCLADVLAEQPRIVGFTSVFQQHVASLALARLIKRERPETFVVFGGANCEGVMGNETLRQFPFVDAVVSGEGDLVFPEVVRRILARESLEDLQGVKTRSVCEREFHAGRSANAPSVQNLDDLPYPDYDDYFEQFRASRYGRTWQPSIPFETSRGCWWGERSHCTFCGLNGAGLMYRSKSARRALDEIGAVARHYPDADFEIVDNILDMRYFREFLPALADSGVKLNLFYETKSNLKKEQIRLLRNAGVRRIQPGIESFSDAVLKLMRKGVTGLQNVQLLKWCKELGVTPEWNFLWGFPGEPAAEYARMANLVPLLTHLPPPVACTDIRLDRFSPNFFDAERLGIADVTPMPAYQYIYPLSAEALANLAYYFTFRYREPQDVEAYVAPLARELDTWRKVGERSDLFAVDLGSGLLVVDLRPAACAPFTLLDELERSLYLACDAACDLPQLTAAAAASGMAVVDPERIANRLEWLVTRGLMLKRGNRYLALAVPLGAYSPPPAVVDRLYYLGRVFGRQRRDGAVVIPLRDIDRAPWRLTVFKRMSVRQSASRFRPHGNRLTLAHFSITDLGEVVIRQQGQEKIADGQKVNGWKEEEERRDHPPEEEGGHPAASPPRCEENVTSNA